MKYKTMYGLHEARMWISMMVSGVVAGATILAANPELRERATNKFNAIKDKVGSIFKKKKEDSGKEMVKFVIVDEKENPLR